MVQELLVATRNQGKVQEYADLLADMNLVWRNLAEVGINLEVAETGATFEENATIKAVAYAQASGLLTLADDSGLEVDYLGGQPGVQTARYGGEGLSPRERYERLLASLIGVPMAERTARFRCVIALADRDGLIATADGVCEGLIAFEPAGTGGFGYDPIFVLPDRKVTMAELPAAEKHKISHRGRALVAMAPILRRKLDQHQSYSQPG